MIIVTSYDSPDLDGIACTIGYTEFLKAQGNEARGIYIGELGLEVEFVSKYLGSLDISRKDSDYNIDDSFVLVDTSDPDSIDKAIDSLKVIEIYDHREIVYTDSFKNAKKVIELVGSCATLISEKFFRSNIEPSADTALLLYSAIISNTVNLSNKVTTDRDREMTEWLENFFVIPDDYVRKMFEFKSEVNKDNLYDILKQDFAVKKVGKSIVGIAQLEVVDLEEKFKDFRNSFEDVLSKLKSEKNVNLLLFTGIDILKGFNIFFTIDKGSEEFFDRVLNVNDSSEGVKSYGIIMRKEIWPKVINELGE